MRVSYHYLLDIALILLTTKVFGLVSKRFHMPQVVGALVAGLVFGPALLNVLHGTEFLSQVPQLGVVVIMFSAGLETDLNELKKTGTAGFLVALVGVLVPLAGGFGFGWLFNRGELAASGNVFLQNVFLGVILTATSVSITVETLKEMGKLSTKMGNTVLAAALIDDILGLLCLTMVTSLGGESAESIWLVLGKIALFMVFAVLAGLAVNKGMAWYCRHQNKNMLRFPVLAFVLCLLMSYSAEHFFGVADIIGAFAAGLAVGSTTQAPYIESQFRPISYMLLTPIFFANIGISIELGHMDAALLVATAVLVVVVATKLVGCGLGAKIAGMKWRQSVQVGLGMVCRGEVALIVANKGMALGLMPPALFAPVVIMVVFTAVVTPVLLKLSFRGENRYVGLQESPLADRMEVVDQLDDVSQRLLQADSTLQDTPKGRRPIAAQKQSLRQSGGFCIPGLFLQRDALHFHQNALGQFPHGHAAAGGLVFDVALIHLVELAEVGHVGQKAHGFHHVIQAGAGGLQHFGQVHHHLVGLGGDVAAVDSAVDLYGNLPRGVNKIAHHNGGAVGPDSRGRLVAHNLLHFHILLPSFRI